MSDSDTVAGRKMRARAEAQNRARKDLREAHPDELRDYYRRRVVEVFAERGLGDPDFR